MCHLCEHSWLCGCGTGHPTTNALLCRQETWLLLQDLHQGCLVQLQTPQGGEAISRLCLQVLASNRNLIADVCRGSCHCSNRQAGVHLEELLGGQCLSHQSLHLTRADYLA